MCFSVEGGGGTEGSLVVVVVVVEVEVEVEVENKMAQ